MRSEVYIFGAGTNGQLCLETCKEHGVSVRGILDNYSPKPSLNGAAIFRPEQAVRHIPVVVTSPTACMDISLQLDWLGFNAILNLSQFKQELGIEPEWKRDLKENRVEYQWLRDWLADDESRRVFDAVVKFRKTLEPAYLAAIQTDLQHEWFDPQFFARRQHVFVDGGAYDGDTALEFIKRCPEYKAAYLFEPSAILELKARERLIGRRDIEVIHAGLLDNKTTCRLQNAGLPSGAIGDEGEKISLVRLDDFNIPATMIKLDVEGCEKAALLGAEQTIETHQPFLAIAAYHRPEDLWELPQLLAGMQDYRFYLRHYTQFYHETVLYCI